VRLTLATWNINSVRLRIDLVARFLREQAPHVLCLQETKCRDSEFPLAAFHKLGYPYAAINGQKGYHGVAIASKLPLTIIDRRSFCEKGDARHIAVTLKPGGAGGRAITLHNFYVPSGGDEPDPAVNPKFAHKLAFLDEMADWMTTERIAGSGAIIADDITRPCCGSSVTRRSRSKNSIPCATRDRGSMRCATLCRGRKNSIRGGAIAHGIGESPIEGGGSTMFRAEKRARRTQKETRRH
jgi:exonuclease III